MVDKNEIPVKPTRLPSTEKLKHDSLKDNDSTYRAHQIKNEGIEKGDKR